MAPWAEAEDPDARSSGLKDAATSVACTLAKWARLRFEDAITLWLRGGGGDDAGEGAIVARAVLEPLIGEKEGSGEPAREDA